MSFLEKRSKQIASIGTTKSIGHFPPVPRLSSVGQVGVWGFRGWNKESMVSSEDLGA